jgi:hypothetical protein
MTIRDDKGWLSAARLRESVTSWDMACLPGTDYKCQKKQKKGWKLPQKAFLVISYFLAFFFERFFGNVLLSYERFAPNGDVDVRWGVEWGGWL